MIPLQFLALAIRFTGLFLVFHSISSIASDMLTLQRDLPDDGQFPYGWLALLFALQMSLAWAMIFHPDAIARRAMPDPKDRSELAANAGSLSIMDIEILAGSLLGLYFLVQAVIDFVWLFTLWLSTRSLNFPWQWTPNHIGAAVASCLELLAALWLLFGIRGLRKILLWARS